MPEARQHYRLRYPYVLRPNLRSGGLCLPVIDICEAGLRFAKPRNASAQIGAEIEATLHFSCGEVVLIRGSVVRLTERDAALQLERRISFGYIMREQRNLMEKAPYSVH